MGTQDSPTTWVPYMSNQDCSQKICNLYCPQWCNYVDLPSPPPPVAFSDDDASGAALSPIVITVIGVFGSVCLLISYYIIISRLCIINNDSSQSLRHRGVQDQAFSDLEMNEDDFNMEDDPLNLGPWHVPGKGLDEVAINSIRVCKYKKGDGSVSGTDCPVCLGEFQEDEKLRLLPKCSHAFHVFCIDNWLTNHSSCPLCRANVSCDNDLSQSHILAPPPPPPPPPPPRPHVRRVARELVGRDAIIDIRQEDGEREVRRSLSMSNLCQSRVSQPHIMFVNQHVDHMEFEELRIENDVGSSKRNWKSEQCRYEHDGGDVNRDMLRRSLSSGRYLFIRGWKAGNSLRVSSVPS